MSEKDNEAQKRLQAIEDRRAERKAKLAEKAAEQLAIDLEAIDALEVQHGDSNVGTIEVPFTEEGVPVRVAVLAPPDVLVKRYQSRIKAKGDEKPDLAEAAKELGAASRIYPPKGEGDEAFRKILKSRAGLEVQMGLVASKLASGRIVDEGKG